MMATHEQLNAVWSAIDLESGELPGTYQRRIADSGTLACYASLVRPDGLRRFSVQVVASACSHLAYVMGRGFELVVEHIAQQSEAILHLQERPGAGKAIFAILCADLIAVSRASSDVALASALFCKRIGAWKRFFEAQGDDGISRESYVGLWGELHAMASMIAAGTPSPDALRAWLGPVGAPQDFSFGLRAVEVKTSVAAQMTEVHVSNAMQLDGSALEALHLVCIHCEFRPSAGITMSVLRDRICAVLGGELSGSFLETLLSRGLANPDVAPWADWGFSVIREMAFVVDDSFPCIRIGDIPAGVVDLSYSVQLGACVAHRVDVASVLSAARFGEQA
ncbi:PD-(D/E)XK motif protein [Lysobacter arenosi]|nr:PD-(D/E)XK motif protein [Lysobacter arenosi]